MSGLHAAGKRKKKKKKKKVLRLTVPMIDRLFWRAGFGPTEAEGILQILFWTGTKSVDRN